MKCTMILPESTVYFRASWATMLTKPSIREVMAEPRSLRNRDSHTRQYCSPHSPRLHQGAWKEPAGPKWGFYWLQLTECLFDRGQRSCHRFMSQNLLICVYISLYLIYPKTSNQA